LGFSRRGIVLVAPLALAMPLAALADSGKRGNDRDDRDRRVFYATNTAGKLLKFNSDEPRKLRSRQITGLPVGVSIKGIDFRPASGDLYALGSDRVVYRLNALTAIAVPEGKSFDQMPSILSGNNNGFDFNPTVDKIRVTSDAGDNLRLNPDDGTLLSVDTKLTPMGVQVVGSAYTNSSFTAFATRPTVTELYAYDVGASPDKLWIQRPANAGTLIMPQSTGLNLGVPSCRIVTTSRTPGATSRACARAPRPGSRPSASPGASRSCCPGCPPPSVVGPTWRR